VYYFNYQSHSAVGFPIWHPGDLFNGVWIYFFGFHVLKIIKWMMRAIFMAIQGYKLLPSFELAMFDSYNPVEFSSIKGYL